MPVFLSSISRLRGPYADPSTSVKARKRATVPGAWAEILEADELFAATHALGLLQEVGAVTDEEARAWRKAIVQVRGLPLPGGATA